ncbi:MAG: hypothetical protein ACI4GW_08260 [Lachnospiraceae bacterium]
MNNKYYEELTEKCNHMGKQDYIDELNEIFKTLETYKLRWFYRFITAKLDLDNDYLQKKEGL